ncbi:MAG: nucleoside hydrolase [Oscillospiraceae bacterium]|nr:nucleoside hydrolase [Oscillospiraceae bacterium]
MNPKLNIIIDTDPGTDDALALGIASVFFKDNIRAVISTYGNTYGEQTYCNLINLADILKIDADFIKGSLNPLEKDSFTPTDYHGKNGLCGLVLPTAKKDLYNGDFVNDIHDILKEYGIVKYIAIGPLTNLARVFDRFPDSANYIDELIIMGGGFEISNVAHSAEFNFNSDPDATNKVLECPVKKVIAPLDMTHQLAFSLTDIEDIVGVKRELLSDSTNSQFNVLAKLFYLNYDTSVTHDNPGSIIHDATTLAYLLDKNKCNFQSYKIISDEYGAVSKNPQGYDVFVIDKIDRDFIKGLLKETFHVIKKGELS